MMRARNLGALVNHTNAPRAQQAQQAQQGRKCAGAGQAEEGGEVAAQAEVVLHFNLLQQQQPGAAGCADGGGGSPGGSVSGTARHPPPSAPTPPATAAEPALVGRLLVRRRVTRAGRSDFAVRQLPPPTACDARSTGSGDAGGGDGRPPWRSVTPAGLRELLAQHGIQTEAVDRWAWARWRQPARPRCSAPCLLVCPQACRQRPWPAGAGLFSPPRSHHVLCLPRFVVTQHRQAVAVADPVQLAHFLELLIGTSGLQVRFSSAC